MVYRKGLFITFEGVEGCGKTTQANIIAKQLEDEGYPVVFTFEPGATKLGAELRALTLHPHERGIENVDPIAETLLYAADRAQHVAEVLLPALQQNKIVLCDRYLDSSLVYQGYARGLGKETVTAMNVMATGDLFPDLTFFLDIDVEKSLRRGTPEEMDRMEKEEIDFHRKVEAAYKMLFMENIDRFHLINADRAIDEITGDIYAEVKLLIQSRWD